MKRWCALLCAAMILAIQTSPLRGDDSVVEGLVRRAQAQEGQGRADLAAQTWRQVLLANPNQQEALAALASYLKQQGDSAGSKEYLERLRRINPSHPAIAAVEGQRIYADQKKRLDEAAQFTASGDYRKAMRIYRDVFGTNPPPGGWAIAYYETEAATPDGWEHATAGLESLVKLYADNDNYKLALGRIYTARPRARQQGLRLLQSIPPGGQLEIKVREAWRQALVWSGSDPAMAPYIKAYLSRFPDAELQRSLADLSARGAALAESSASIIRGRNEKLGYDALNANQLDAAQRYFELALAAVPASPGGLSGLGFVRMKLQDFDGAADYFEKAKAAAPANKSIAEALDTARFWRELRAAAKALDEGRDDKAIDLYKRAVAARPTDIDAAMGLAGAYMHHGNPSEAIPLYAQVTRAQPGNTEAWIGLVNANQRQKTPEEVLVVVNEVPSDVQAGFRKNLNDSVMMASAYAKAGRQMEAASWLRDSLNLVQTQKSVIPINLQLELGGVYLNLRQPESAARIFQRTVDTNPATVDAWEGLISAQLQMQDGAARANNSLQRMPPAIYDLALKRPSFLRSIASVYAAMKRFDLAESLLRQAGNQESKDGGEVSRSTQLQLAQVLSAAGQTAEADGLFQMLVAKWPNDPDVWKGWITNLHSEKNDVMALSEMKQIPAELVVPLSRDPNFVALQAAIYTANGLTEEALQSVKQAIAQYEIEKAAIPANLQIQLAWALLGEADGESELYATLQSASARSDLDSSQRREISQIWSTWVRRSAHAEVLRGNSPKAISILRAGAQLLPNDTGVRSDLAGDLLTAGDSRGAFSVYQAWGLKDGSADDYGGAIGAAISVSDKAAAAQWLDQALQKYPANSRLLMLAARQASAAGDYKKAESYLVLAKAAAEKENLTPSTAVGVPRQTVASNAQSAAVVLGQLLVGTGAAQDNRRQTEPGATFQSLPLSSPDFGPLPPSPAPRQTPGGRGSAPPQIPNPDQLFSPVSSTTLEKSGNEERKAKSAPASPVPLRSVAFSAAADSGRSTSDDAEQFRRLLQSSQPESGGSFGSDQQTSGGSAAANSSPVASYADAPPALTVSVPPQRSVQQEIDDQLAQLQSRNTPYFSSGALIQGRSGQPGYDKLTGEEGAFAASAAIGDTARLSLFVRPVFLDSGTADGTSTLRFGSLPEGVAPPTVSQSGVAADVQLSTPILGLRFGSTPLGFLVSNFIGGLRVRPANGPITLLFSRDSVKDTMLSYAGNRDPVTGQKWGGVMANTAQILGTWGGAKSGVYFNAGYQFIDGKNVKSNSRVDGTAGAYYQIVSRPEGALTVGLNFSAMHYANNLRYFTFGQGGYFSPQLYFLFNIPVRWTGTWKQVQYSFAGSIGAQHFQENATPFFPTQPYYPAQLPSPGVGPPYYSSNSDTGPNYSLEGRAAYQFSPYWSFGFFANVNNAREFTAGAVGVSVQYFVRPRPLTEDLYIPSLPDWRGSATPTFP